MRKLLTVVGARPQFIKAAPLSRRLQRSGKMVEVLVHTGQHYDYNMSEVMFRELDIPAPTHNLGIQGGTHGQMTGRMLAELERVMIDEKPDAVLVYGDTNSTLAGALSAAKLKIPLVHVEAGLRSFNRRMPEEVNRVTADHLSDVLFCPTQVSVDNLAAEGIRRNVHLVGDLMFDTTLAALEVSTRNSGILRELGVLPGSYSVLTVHRQESTDDPGLLRQLLEYVADQSTATKVFPIHPRTRAALTEHGLDGLLTRFQVTEPLGYLDMTWLLHNANTIYTDSGGVQKEAYFHRIPCVTLRSETEWVETVQCGWNRLWTVDSYAPRSDISDYGSGQSAQAMLTLLDKAIG